MTSPVDALDLNADGIAGDRHVGLRRRAGPREPWLPRGLDIHNDRQLTAVSVEELARIAAALDVPQVRPEWLGANLVTEGLPDLSRIAAGSRLAFGGEWSGKGTFDGQATLRVSGYNFPCRGPGRVIAEACGQPELEFAFVKAAASLRGLILFVDHPGRIAPGDAVVVIEPATAP
ncbi:MAG: MOSC domain-containing protein [Bosea sp. (in: a-proteobacteria)]